MKRSISIIAPTVAPLLLILRSLVSDLQRIWRKVDTFVVISNRWMNKRWWLRRRAIHVFGMCALTFMAMPMLGGCGAGGFLAIGGLCIPCGAIYLIGGVIAALIFLDMGGDKGPRPPRDPSSPPGTPPDPQALVVCTSISLSAKCAIDGTFVCDLQDQGSVPAWVYGGPDAVPDPDNPGFYMGPGPDRMIWPAVGRDINCTPVWTQSGGTKSWRKSNFFARMGFHFANGDELYVNVELTGYQEFILDWRNDQPYLLGVKDHHTGQVWHPPYTTYIAQRE